VITIFGEATKVERIDKLANYKPLDIHSSFIQEWGKTATPLFPVEMILRKRIKGGVKKLS
jgi:hypothetical protein